MAAKGMTVHAESNRFLALLEWIYQLSVCTGFSCDSVNMP